MHMTFKRRLLAQLIVVAMAGTAMGQALADDSVTRASAASIGGSLLVGSVVGWTAYQGSELTVKAVRASGDGVELVLQGASGAIETSAKVSGEAVHAAGVGIGTSVKVVAESTGYALIGAGVLLAFVPNEIGRALLHSARHERRPQ
jgi:hypothetical protein